MKTLRKEADSSSRGRNQALLWVLLLSVPIVLMVFDLTTGSVHISFSKLWGIITGKGDGETMLIVARFRYPRVFTALLAGISLSVAGLIMQTVFRNPLAGPYVLGISSGASLGVALLVLGLSGRWAVHGVEALAAVPVAAAAVAGAMAVLLLIMVVATRIRDIMTLLILGIMFGSAVSALVTVLQYFSNETMLKIYVIWTMGSLSHVTGHELYLLLGMTLAGMTAAFAMTKQLNTLMMGEVFAASVGMRMRRVRLFLFGITGLLAGSVTAFCGPVGFVGIVAPHLARMVLGTSNIRQVLPATVLTGASLLLLGDLLAHLPGEGSVLPINAVTALLGIPLIIWMILRKHHLSTLI